MGWKREIEQQSTTRQHFRNHRQRQNTRLTNEFAKLLIINQARYRVVEKIKNRKITTAAYRRMITEIYILFREDFSLNWKMWFCNLLFI